MRTTHVRCFFGFLRFGRSEDRLFGLEKTATKRYLGLIYINQPRGGLAARFGSWSCKNAFCGRMVVEAGTVWSQAAIAAISGLVPTMFMARVRL